MPLSAERVVARVRRALLLDHYGPKPYPKSKPPSRRLRNSPRIPVSTANQWNVLYDCGAETRIRSTSSTAVTQVLF
jgi:hypothetical protein